MARPIWEQYNEDDLRKAGLLPEEEALPMVDLGPDAGRIPAGLPGVDYADLPPGPATGSANLADSLAARHGSMTVPAPIDDMPAIKPSDWRNAPPVPAPSAPPLPTPSRAPAGPVAGKPGASNEELVRALSANLGEDKEDYRNKLKAAQKERDHRLLTADLSDATNQLSNALTGMNLDNSASVKARRDQAENSIKDVDKNFEGRKNDPNSDMSKAYREFFKKRGYDFGDNLSAEDLEKISPQVNALEISKQSADARKEAARMHAETLAESRASRKDTQSQARQDRLDREAKLSDKQVGDVTQFDDSLEKMEAAVGLLGKHKNWVGPIDGRIPDVVTPADQTAFRSAVGRMEDAYRHLITGAGASNQELARLQSRLPSASDSYDQFQAKAQGFANEVRKARAKHLENYERSGKNIASFREPSGRSPSAPSPSAPAAPVAAHPQDSQALAWAKANPNDPRASEILRKNGL